MKKQVYRLCFVILGVLILVSCSENDDSILTEANREMTLNIDGELFEFKENEPYAVLGGNTNCNKIFFNTLLSNDLALRFNIELLKNGQLVDAKIIQLTPESPHFIYYLTEDFKPKSSFEISNFNFDPLSNDIEFDFDGTLFREDDESFNDKKIVNGSVRLKSYTDVDCSEKFLDYIEYKTETFEFFSTRATHGTNSENPYHKHVFWSNNGHLLRIIGERDFWDMPIGTYDFDENSSINKVFLSRYLGPTKATLERDYNEEEWEALETIGNFTIDQKLEDGYAKRIEGSITMEVFSNGQFLFSVENMKFKTGSFE